MNADKLLQELRYRNLHLPKHGSGSMGKILNSDLIKVLATDSLKQMKNPSKGLQMRLEMVETMLAYRFDSLKDQEKENILKDNNGWIAEEKYNGCRMIVTHYPGEGLRFFGRNRSIQTFLPIDYTDKILIDGKLSKSPEITPTKITAPFILDCELITGGFVEIQSGSFAQSLNAAVAVLQLNDIESHNAQKTTAPLSCIVFDCLSYPVDWRQPLSERKQSLAYYVNRLQKATKSDFFETSAFVSTGKKALYDKIIAQGGEGIILKNLDMPYMPGINGFRSKKACIKMKRSLKEQHTQDIDAYIIGCTSSEDYHKQGLIAGIKLAVLLRSSGGELKEHWIATVSNMPDAVRTGISNRESGTLKQSFYNKVLTIDGLGISARNKRIAHAKVDWTKSFRYDKSPEQCIVDEEFIESQVF